MVVDDAVEALVDVLEHVHDFHGRAVLAQSGETDYVTEIYGHFLVQLWLHQTSLLQAFHHRPTDRNMLKDRRNRLSDQRNQLKQVLYKLFGTLSPFFFSYMNFSYLFQLFIHYF